MLGDYIGQFQILYKASFLKSWQRKPNFENTKVLEIGNTTDAHAGLKYKDF